MHYWLGRVEYPNNGRVYNPFDPFVWRIACARVQLQLQPQSVLATRRDATHLRTLHYELRNKRARKSLLRARSLRLRHRLRRLLLRQRRMQALQVANPVLKAAARYPFSCRYFVATRRAAAIAPRGFLASASALRIIRFLLRGLRPPLLSSPLLSYRILYREDFLSASLPA